MAKHNALTGSAVKGLNIIPELLHAPVVHSSVLGVVNLDGDNC